MSYNFHIGQEIVAIKNHSNGEFKKYDLFIVISLKMNKCCGSIAIDIGKISYCELEQCACSNLSNSTDNIYWFTANSFAPLDSLTNIDELTEILEQPLFEVK